MSVERNIYAFVAGGGTTFDVETRDIFAFLIPFQNDGQSIGFDIAVSTQIYNSITSISNK